ncbi:MAG: VOC family protein [Candidatus Dormibacteria bacterium]
MFGVWHFSFTVSNLDQAVAFYTRHLGLECILRQEQDNEYSRTLVGYPNARLRIAQLVVPGQPRRFSSHDLELVEYVTPKGRRQDDNICNPGAAHLALTVSHIHLLHSRMRTEGVEFFSAPVYITAGVNQGGYSVYFYGPDRIVHELVQPPPQQLPASQPETIVVGS